MQSRAGSPPSPSCHRSLAGVHVVGGEDDSGDGGVGVVGQLGQLSQLRRPPHHRQEGRQRRVQLRRQNRTLGGRQRMGVQARALAALPGRTCSTTFLPSTATLAPAAGPGPASSAADARATASSSRGGRWRAILVVCRRRTLCAMRCANCPADGAAWCVFCSAEASGEFVCGGGMRIDDCPNRSGGMRGPHGPPHGCSRWGAPNNTEPCIPWSVHHQ